MIFVKGRIAFIFILFAAIAGLCIADRDEKEVKAHDVETCDSTSDATDTAVQGIDCENRPCCCCKIKDPDTDSQQGYQLYRSTVSKCRDMNGEQKYKNGGPDFDTLVNCTKIKWKVKYDDNGEEKSRRPACRKG
eukprot:CAMPEP_0115682438 /NCGR_PEP_ID=MMETSP0272-20121206/57850_1 /TAXON_ID=71861 /ORGANISM="Scrippsiella trochoidea, Strain CCMP3099" /LENGTH=133 /DNA_ID=CAMNT_0003121805 /DNA_START=62 /DNA_END=463 /DNA_ORIENTATION=+